MVGVCVTPPRSARRTPKGIHCGFVFLRTISIVLPLSSPEQKNEQTSRKSATPLFVAILGLPYQPAGCHTAARGPFKICNGLRRRVESRYRGSPERPACRLRPSNCRRANYRDLSDFAKRSYNWRLHSTIVCSLEDRQAWEGYRCSVSDFNRGASGLYKCRSRPCSETQRRRLPENFRRKNRS